jgi:hypothetical protein
MTYIVKRTKHFLCSSAAFQGDSNPPELTSLRNAMLDELMMVWKICRCMASPGESNSVYKRRGQRVILFFFPISPPPLNLHT